MSRNADDSNLAFQVFLHSLVSISIFSDVTWHLAVIHLLTNWSLKVRVSLSSLPEIGDQIHPPNPWGDSSEADKRKRPRHGDKKPRKEDREEKSRKRSTGATGFQWTLLTLLLGLVPYCSCAMERSCVVIFISENQWTSSGWHASHRDIWMLQLSFKKTSCYFDTR